MEKQEELGALWAKKSSKGADYFSGTFTINGEKIPVVAFYNATKKNPNEPDYRILKSKPKEEQLTNSLPTRPEEDINPQDVPF